MFTDGMVKNDINISRGGDINMEQFEENSEFELLFEDITKFNEVNNDRGIRITINLKRHPLFYIFTIILVLLLFLYTFVFLQPSECGKKTSMALSVFLRFQLFLSITRDFLPKNSLTVSLFSLYVSLAKFTSRCCQHTPPQNEG